MAAVLSAIQQELTSRHLSWAHVLYVHLYLADMAQFGAANEAYMKCITALDCPWGVPSRSTVELPLGAAGLGPVMADVVATAGGLSKQVLHVQSMSRWAPCCIGPYSQVGPTPPPHPPHSPIPLLPLLHCQPPCSATDMLTCCTARGSWVSTPLPWQ